jgi:uncharacterized membrane protein
VKTEEMVLDADSIFPTGKRRLAVLAQGEVYDRVSVALLALERRAREVALLMYRRHGYVDEELIRDQLPVLSIYGVYSIARYADGEPLELLETHHVNIPVLIDSIRTGAPSIVLVRKIHLPC